MKHCMLWQFDYWLLGTRNAVFFLMGYIGFVLARFVFIDMFRLSGGLTITITISWSLYDYDCEFAINALILSINALIHVLKYMFLSA